VNLKYLTPSLTFCFRILPLSPLPLLLLPLLWPPQFSLQNPGWLVDSAKGAKDYGVGLWQRLNGQGSGGKAVKPSELGLPAPMSVRGDVEVLADKLSLEVRGSGLVILFSSFLSSFPSPPHGVFLTPFIPHVLSNI
jgi:hypothetical protein